MKESEKTYRTVIIGVIKRKAIIACISNEEDRKNQIERLKNKFPDFIPNN